ncbi:myeloid leukemia factor isoform X2 [Prorops nasuta]|uniref:myeloid leukemia factor isoform X2 n=1 Tax=Prorops nasuta TaxID=863751 RepID=UPI0034CFA6B8
MSLFGALTGVFDDDPILGSFMQSMRSSNSMMNSLFGDPMGMARHHQALMPPNPMMPHMSQAMMPLDLFSMPPMNMNAMFNYENMANGGNCHSFVSRSVMTMGRGPDGRPQVYQETRSETTAPGGVKETKKTVCDSRTGTKKMAIGHHIGDRAHILEREQNIHNGEQEEHQEFINLDEDEAETFNKEWEQKARHGYAGSRHGHSSRRLPEPISYKQLALPDSASSSSDRRSSPEGLTSDVKATATQSSAAPARSRKREHTPDPKATSNKRHTVSDSKS